MGPRPRSWGVANPSVHGAYAPMSTTPAGRTLTHSLEKQLLILAAKMTLLITQAGHLLLDKLSGGR